MPKSKKRTKVTKPSKTKTPVSKDLIIGIAIGAIIIFVVCLMMLPGGQSVGIDR